MRQWLMRPCRASHTQRFVHLSRSVRVMLPLMGALGFSVLAAQVSALPIAQAATKQPANAKAAHANSLCLAGLRDAAACAQTSAQTSAQTTLSAATFGHLAQAQASQTQARQSAPAVAYVTLASQSTTRASTAQTSARSSASGSVPAMIRQTFGPYAARALAVASCESGYNPSARNSSSGAMGVFQFMPGTWRGTSYAGYSPYNAWANIQAAHQVFVRDGYSWSEWSC